MSVVALVFLTACSSEQVPVSDGGVDVALVDTNVTDVSVDTAVRDVTPDSTTDGARDAVTPDTMTQDVGGGGTDDGDQGDACACSAEPAADPGTYKVCSGTGDGCIGFGLTGQLRCLARNSDGVGTCEFMCSMADEGVRGSCPINQLCRQDVPSISGDWYRCL